MAALKLVLAVVCGLVLGSAVNMALIMVSGHVIPPPAAADQCPTPRPRTHCRADERRCYRPERGRVWMQRLPVRHARSPCQSNSHPAGMKAKWSPLQAARQVPTEEELQRVESAASSLVICFFGRATPRMCKRKAKKCEREVCPDQIQGDEPSRCWNHACCHDAAHKEK